MSTTLTGKTPVPLLEVQNISKYFGRCDSFARNGDNTGDKRQGRIPLITNFLTLGAIPNLLDGQQTAVPSP